MGYEVSGRNWKKIKKEVSGKKGSKEQPYTKISVKKSYVFVLICP